MLSCLVACDRSSKADGGAADGLPKAVESSREMTVDARNRLETLQGVWRMDVAATRTDLIDRKVLSSPDARGFLPDERVVRLVVDEAGWSLLTNGREIIRHGEGTFDPEGGEGGLLRGIEVLGRPTEVEVRWIRPGDSFWAQSRHHQLWEGYREKFVWESETLSALLSPEGTL
jgi:hypothetical protein